MAKDGDGARSIGEVAAEVIEALEIRGSGDPRQGMGAGAPAREGGQTRPLARRGGAANGKPKGPGTEAPGKVTGRNIERLRVKPLNPAERPQGNGDGAYSRHSPPQSGGAVVIPLEAWRERRHAQMPSRRNRRCLSSERP